MRRKLSGKQKFRWMLWQLQRYRCPLCEKQIRQRNLFDNDRTNIDHIIPKSCGGAGFSYNLRVTHKACNETRGNRCACYYPGYGEEYCHPNARHDDDPPWVPEADGC